MSRWLFYKQDTNENIQIADCSESDAISLASTLQAAHVEIPQNATDSTHYVDANGSVSEFPARPSNYHNWNWTTLNWSLAESGIDKARERRKAEINKLREEKMSEPILFNGALFDADPASLQNMQGVMARIERGDGLTAGWIGWRTYDNSMVWANSSPEEVLSNLRSIASELENRKQSLLTTSWQHKEAIAMLTSLDQVLAYDTSQGWSV